MNAPPRPSEPGLSGDGIKEMLRCLRTAMAANRDRLVTLDSVLGDGDLGLTMAAASAQAAEQVAAMTETLPGRLLVQSGVTFARTAPSTMGTLVGTGFMRGGKAVADAPSFDTRAAAAFFKGMADGISQRGRAKPGEKTILDVMHPVAITLERAAVENRSLAEAMNQAGLAAIRGAEAATLMKAQHGRAAYFQDQSIGKEDPGCAVGMLIIQSFQDAITKMQASSPEPSKCLPDFP